MLWTKPGKPPLRDSQLPDPANLKPSLNYQTTEVNLTTFLQASFFSCWDELESWTVQPRAVTDQDQQLLVGQGHGSRFPTSPRTPSCSTRVTCGSRAPRLLFRGDATFAVEAEHLSAVAFTFTAVATDGKEGIALRTSQCVLLRSTVPIYNGLAVVRASY